jgi:putative membrane protein
MSEAENPGRPKPGRINLPLWPSGEKPGEDSPAPVLQGIPAAPPPANANAFGGFAALDSGPYTISSNTGTGNGTAPRSTVSPAGATPHGGSTHGGGINGGNTGGAGASSRPRPGRVALPPWSESAAGAAEETPLPPPLRKEPPLRKGMASPNRGRRFRRAVLAFVIALLIYDAADFLIADWNRSPFLGVLFALLLVLVFGSGIALIIGEYRQYRKLHLTETYHEKAAELLAGNGYGQAVLLTARLLPALPVTEAARENYSTSVADTHTDADVIHLFGRMVLRPLDQQAYAIITRASRDAAVGVAVSPVAALDTVIALWRSLRMIREIAQVYGFRPGFAGTLLLARRLLLTAGLTATTDVIGNLWAEHLGGKLAGIISAKLGEGVFAAIRVARLGLITMEMCRPLPFLKEDEPSLNRLRKEIFAGLL